MKKILRLIFLGPVLLLGGCAANIMLDSPSPEAQAPAADKAVIVFMRSSFVASAVSAVLFEVNNGNLELVGEIPNGRKIAHATDPGEKVYMGVGLSPGSSADFMIAKVEKGKTYYSIVRPNWASGAFIPTPVRTDGTSDFNTGIPEFEKWVQETKLIMKGPKAGEWLEANREKYNKVYQKRWQQFNTKTPEQIQERTLMPADGM